MNPGDLACNIDELIEHEQTAFMLQVWKHSQELLLKHKERLGDIDLQPSPFSPVVLTAADMKKATLGKGISGAVV